MTPVITIVSKAFSTVPCPSYVQKHYIMKYVLWNVVSVPMTHFTQDCHVTGRKLMSVGYATEVAFTGFPLFY